MSLQELVEKTNNHEHIYLKKVWQGPKKITHSSLVGKEDSKEVTGES